MTNTKIKWCLVSIALAALVGFGAAGTAKANIIGDEVHGTLNFGGFGTTNFFDPANYSVPAGSSEIQPLAVVDDVDASFFEFMFDGLGSIGSTGINVDIDDGTISINQFLTDIPFGAALNSWDIWITDMDWLDMAGEITNATILSNDFFTNLDVAWGPHSIHIINSCVSNDCAVAQATAVIGFDAVHVPEPSTLLLLGFGLAGLVGVRRKSKRA